LLEHCSPNVEWKVKAEAWRFYKANDCCHKRFESAISAKEVRTREAVFQVTNQGTRIVAQQNRTDSPFALPDEDGPEGCLSHCETDVLILSSSFERAGFHAEYLVGTAIKAAA
jgi:hypothetical protein